MSSNKQMKLEIDMTFEKALEELNNIVTLMEEGNLSLERALELYQEGVKLASFCKLQLERAQKKVEVLKRGKDGTMVFEQFEISDEICE